MPAHEAPCVELEPAPESAIMLVSPSPSEISSASSPEPQNIRATPLFRALAMVPPEPDQPPGQDELGRRLPGYRRIVIPRELTLIELLKQYSGVETDEEVLQIREVKLRVIAERVGLRRLHVLAPRLRSLTLDNSALSSLRDLGIGLVHLKYLSVNRCNLSSLDGVWGLGNLRELHAVNNRLQDLQPLAALQKLHTLDLSGNPISESNRLWTLAVCNALRRLTLNNTPISDTEDYRSRLASTLPMLVYLDDRPLHTDIEFEIDDVLAPDEGGSSASEDDHEDLREQVKIENSLSAEPVPSSSHCVINTPELTLTSNVRRAVSATHRRPATTENAGTRPDKPQLPVRPKTAAVDRRLDKTSKLEIMNTLMDEEWLGSGSEMTSRGPVCGNIAQALRRRANRRNQHLDHEGAERELINRTVSDASRVLAAEIPRAPKSEDWARFRLETGIDIDINFNEPSRSDANSAIERLERIEKETSERFNQIKNYFLNDDEQLSSTASSVANTRPLRCTASKAVSSDEDSWAAEDAPDPRPEVDYLFYDLMAMQRGESDSAEAVYDATSYGINLK